MDDLAKEYLENICQFNKIDVVTGQLTAMLRQHWGLNSVISEVRHESQQNAKKNRDDHRHHAIDAIVVGMTTRSLLQKVSAEAKRAEEKYELNRLFESKPHGSPIDPWDGFRQDVVNSVQDIVVSHKVNRRKFNSQLLNNKIERSVTDGKLHNETAYGIVSGPDKKGYYHVVVRKPIEKLVNQKHIESIRDGNLRRKFMNVFDSSGKKGIIDLAEARGIRSLRRIERLKVIPIQNDIGKDYKAYKGDSNWGVEIFEYTGRHRKSGKWESIVISRFKANKADFQPGVTCRPHPAAKLIMRLQFNDCIEISDNGQKRIMRLQKITKNGTLTFSPHEEANVDSRNQDNNDLFCFWEKSANKLKQYEAKKIHISPTGLIQKV